MKFNKKILFVVILTLVLILLVKIIADKVRSDGERELNFNQNPQKALQKYQFAQNLWPPFRYDKTFQNFMGYIQKSIDKPIVVFLKDKTTEVDLQNFIKEIQSMQGVKKVNYISQEEALEKYKERNKNNPNLIELVTPNILPASIEIYLEDFDIREQIIDIVKTKPFVTHII